MTPIARRIAALEIRTAPPAAGTRFIFLELNETEAQARARTGCLPPQPNDMVLSWVDAIGLDELGRGGVLRTDDMTDEQLDRVIDNLEVRISGQGVSKQPLAQS